MPIVRFYRQTRIVPSFTYLRLPGQYVFDPCDEHLATVELPDTPPIPEDDRDLIYLLEEEFAAVRWGRSPFYLGIALGKPTTFFEWKARYAELVRLVREAAASVKPQD